MSQGTPTKVHRSGVTLTASLLDGFCRGLLFAAQTGQTVGETTRQLAAKLRKDALTDWEGRFTQDLPNFGAESTLGDFLVLAETLKAAAFAFLNPDEFEEVRKGSAFNLAELSRRGSEQKSPA